MLAPCESGGLARNAWATRPPEGDSPWKHGVIPHGMDGLEAVHQRSFGSAGGAARDPSACWRCKGPPRPRRVSGLRGRTDALGLRYGPDSYGRQQLRIFRNGRKPDGATPRARWRPEGCKVLLREKKKRGKQSLRGDGIP